MTSLVRCQENWYSITVRDQSILSIAMNQLSLDKRTGRLPYISRDTAKLTVHQNCGTELPGLSLTMVSRTEAWLLWIKKWLP